MSLNDRKRAVQLLQQHDPGQFVRQRHAAQRQQPRRALSRRFAEAVCWSHGKEQGIGIPVLLLLQKTREFFRTQLLALTIEQDNRQTGPAGHPVHLLQQRGFRRKSESVYMSVCGKPLEVLAGESLDGRILGLADPSDPQFHGEDLTTNTVSQVLRLTWGFPESPQTKLLSISTTARHTRWLCPRTRNPFFARPGATWFQIGRLQPFGCFPKPFQVVVLAGLL